MLRTKKKLIDFIKNLPNNLTIHEVVYQLEMEEQLEKAQEDSQAGRLLNSEEVKERLKDWLV